MKITKLEKLQKLFEHKMDFNVLKNEIKSKNDFIYNESKQYF